MDHDFANSPGPIAIDFQKTNGVKQRIEAQTLIIACDPQKLGHVMKFTSQEDEIFQAFKSYTFHTTLVEVDVDKNNPAPFGVVLKPKAIDDLSGTVCGWRNETAKMYSLETANTMDRNLVTIYQLRETTDPAWNSADFLAELHRILPKMDWWYYGSDFRHAGQDMPQLADLTTRYFNHFDDKGLAAELPWEFLNIQGQNNTFYVHASTCFESVLQCYQYIENLFETRKPSLPSDSDAPIAILGAGVSGMLAARSLKFNHGYTNVTLYEITDRFGGKTVTVTEDAPKPASHDPATACELGTCYLSPAYDKMYADLHKYFEGNPRRGFRIRADGTPTPDQSFRGMVTEDQFQGVPNMPAVLPYDQFVVLKGLYEAGVSLDADPKTLQAEFTKRVGPALKAYLKLHKLLMGEKLPMPDKPPRMLLTGVESGSFYSYLKRNNLLILSGLLEYAYSVQGYGPLKQIPAYYGLVWISVPMVEAIIESFQPSDDPAKNKPLVTYLEKGWLEVWRKMATDLHIETDMIAQTIERRP